MAVLAITVGERGLRDSGENLSQAIDKGDAVKRYSRGATAKASNNTYGV